MRPSESLPCVECGSQRRPNANKCVECHNEAKRAYWRAQKSGNVDAPARKKGRSISAFLAVEDHLRITPSTVVQCYYSKPFRVCLFAYRRTDAMKWLKANTGFVKEDFIVASVCTISQVDVNLTDIDLAQYGWTPKQVTIRHREVA